MRGVVFLRGGCFFREGENGGKIGLKESGGSLLYQQIGFSNIFPFQVLLGGSCWRLWAGCGRAGEMVCGKVRGLQEYPRQPWK